MKNVFGRFLAPDGTSFDTPEETVAYWDSITQEAQEETPMIPTCKDCQYYVPAKQEATNTPMGQCRRYPPAALTTEEIQICNNTRLSYTEMTRFPLVHPKHFCGEYKGTK